MAFDINTAKPVKTGFDINTAKPVQDFQFGGGQARGGQGSTVDAAPPAPFGSYDDPRAVMNRAAGVTPEQLAQSGHPVAAGFQKAGQDMITIPAHFMNQLLMNAPRSLQQTYTNTQFPETDNPIANPLAKAAGVAGALATGGGVLAAPKTLLGKAGASAALGASYSPTEDFGDIGQRATQGAISAALPLAGAGVSKVAQQIPKGKNIVSARLINSLIKPLKKDFAYGKNAGLAVAKEKIVANNLDDLAIKVSGKKKEVGKLIEKKLKGSTQSVGTAGLTRPVDLLLAKANKTPSTNKALITRLQGVKEDIVGMVKGKKMVTVRDANKIKRQIGEITKWTGNDSDDKAVNKALKMVYGKLKTRIETKVPTIKALNERYGNLLTAESATNYRNAIAQRQNMISFGAGQAGLTTGLMTAFATGGQAIPSIVVGSSIAGLVQAMKSPAIKTRVSSWLSTASQKEQKALFSKMPQLQKAIMESGIIGSSRAVDKLSSE